MNRFHSWRSRAVSSPKPKFSRAEHATYAAVSLAVLVVVLALGAVALEWSVGGLVTKWREVSTTSQGH